MNRSPTILLVGPVLTIKEISGPLGTYRTEDFQMGKIIDTAQPGDVLVFDNGGKEISTWGGLASTAAKLKQVRGVIIDGGSRDADEVEALNFPVFSRHITPRAARSRIKMVEMNGAIQCSGFRVQPGDIAVADQTGIIIPKEQAEAVLQKAQAMEAGEKYFVDELKKGKTFEEMHKETGTL
jgi:regulator of RNase E activity RraA